MKRAFSASSPTPEFNPWGDAPGYGTETAPSALKMALAKEEGTPIPTPSIPFLREDYPPRRLKPKNNVDIRSRIQVKRGFAIDRGKLRRWEQKKSCCCASARFNENHYSSNEKETHIPVCIF